MSETSNPADGADRAPTPDHSAFLDTLTPVIAAVAGRPWDADLARHLNEAFPPDGPVFRAIEAACAAGIEGGWMGLQGDDRRKGGRVIQPGPATHDLSVDVVELVDLTGPHHRHPGGEVCAVIPEREEGRFDGNPRGWAVYSPGSDHWPSGTGGRVRVMFFLPGGAIEYTDQAANLGSGSGAR
jgi:hypothetical protein